MSARRENARDTMEHACMLCRRVEADPNICGDKLYKNGICAHELCVYFANELYQKYIEDSGFMGFSPKDIRYIIELAEQKDCFVCGESGATITCREMGCRRNFHLPCAMEGGCITQYFGLYRSFCWEHRPEQAVEAAPEEDTVCLICLDSVGDRMSYSTIVCPACKRAWLHRNCIQAHAFHLGYLNFSCPHCKNSYQYRKEMLNMGIRIPDSAPSSDEEEEDAGNQRQRRCDASRCLCPGGREQAEEEGPWQLLLCSSCGAENTHRRCSSVSSSRASWECDGCAGLGTASSASSQLAGPSTVSQAEEGPSRGSPTPGTSSPSTISQAEEGPSRGSPTPGTSSPSTASQLPSGSSCRSPEIEGRGRSSPPGPVRVRDLSRIQRQAQNPYSRPRRHRARSCAPGSTEESSTRSQALRGTSHSSPVANTSSPSTTRQLPLGSSSGSPSLNSSSRSTRPGPARTRESSRVERWAQNPYSRPRRGRARSRAPGSTEESSTRSQAVRGSSHRSPVANTSSPSTTRQLPSGSSSGSPSLESGSRSTRPGPARTRESSRVERRAQNPYSRPRRRRRSSCAPSPRAGPYPPPLAQ